MTSTVATHGAGGARVLRLLIMGPPGVGKGTQSSLLSEWLGIPTLSTGDLFRRMVKEESDLGLTIKRTIESGGFVSDEVTTQVVRSQLDRPELARGFLLDGYPRTRAQVIHLDQALSERKVELNAVVALSAPRDELVSRLAARSLAQGRADDTPETMATRVDLYVQETQPIESIYQARGQLIQVDGSGPVGVVAAAIRTAIEKFVQRQTDQGPVAP